jgi:hypothetical protein
MVSSIDEFDWKTFKKDQISFESKNVNLISDIYKKASRLGFCKLKVVGFQFVFMKMLHIPKERHQLFAHRILLYYKAFLKIGLIRRIS